MGDGAEVGETFTKIANVTNITGLGLSLDLTDVTTHDQAERWEEQVATVKRTGNCSLSIVYDPADGTHDATIGLLAAIESKEAVNFELEFPDASEYAFTAYVIGFTPTAPVAGALTADIQLKPTGAPTII